jgi:hypothetical protein
LILWQVGDITFPDSEVPFYDYQTYESALSRGPEPHENSSKKQNVPFSSRNKIVQEGCRRIIGVNLEKVIDDVETMVRFREQIASAKLQQGLHANELKQQGRIR